MYQRKILDAACVDVSKDNEEQISQKIRRMWSASKTQLKCNNAQFDVADRNVLKFAVSSLFTDFLDDAIYWKVELNQVDQIDQRTVLDYVQFQIERNQGSSLESRFRNYYRMLREGGAKHKSEL